IVPVPAKFRTPALLMVSIPAPLLTYEPFRFNTPPAIETPVAPLEFKVADELTLMTAPDAMDNCPPPTVYTPSTVSAPLETLTPPLVLSEPSAATFKVPRETVTPPLVLSEPSAAMPNAPAETVIEPL